MFCREPLTMPKQPLHWRLDIVNSVHAPRPCGLGPIDHPITSVIDSGAHWWCLGRVLLQWWRHQQRRVVVWRERHKDNPQGTGK